MLNFREGDCLLSCPATADLVHIKARFVSDGCVKTSQSWSCRWRTTFWQTMTRRGKHLSSSFLISHCLSLLFLFFSFFFVFALHSSHVWHSISESSNLSVARFEVLTAACLKIQIIWDVAPFWLVNSYHCTGRNIPEGLNLLYIYCFASVNHGSCWSTPATRSGGRSGSGLVPLYILLMFFIIPTVSPSVFGIT